MLRLVANFLILHVFVARARVINLEINRNVDAENVDFNARVDTAGAILNTCWFFSADVEYEDNRNDEGVVQDAEAEFEAVFGMINAGLGLPLSVFLASLEVSADYTAPDDDTAGEFDAEAASNFAANVYWSLEEINSDDTVVQEIELHQGLPIVGPFNWRISAAAVNKDENEIVKSCTFEGTKPGKSDFSVTTTFVKSSIVGTVEGALVTPNSIESFIEIDNFPYMEDDTHVRLVMFVGMAAAERSVGWSGSEQLETDGQAYFTLDHTAQVDNQVSDVEISAFRSVDLEGTFGNDGLEASLTAAYEGSATIHRVTVDFPDGATNIVYDPGMGVGDAPQGDGAHSVANFMICIVLALGATLWAL